MLEIIDQACARNIERCLNISHGIQLSLLPGTIFSPALPVVTGLGDICDKLSYAHPNRILASRVSTRSKRTQWYEREGAGAYDGLSFVHCRLRESPEPTASAAATCSTRAHDIARLSENCEGRKVRAEQAKARAVHTWPIGYV